MNILFRVIVIGLVLGFTFSASAQVKFNGFASVKAGITLGSDDELYKYTDQFSFKNESLIALQFTADLQEKLSVTGQLIGRGAESYDAGFEWAYISYHLTDQVKLNAGRIKTPFYKYTDFVDVGYTYDWMRVPQAVYNLNFTSLDGVSLYYTSEFLGFDSSVLLNVGSNDGNPEINGNIVQGKLRDGYAMTWELSRDFVALRLAHLGGELTMSDPQLNGFADILTQAGFGDLADSLLLDEDRAKFYGVALTLDKNDWIFVSEVTQTKLADTLVADRRAYYASLGHRFGAVTPFISFEHINNSAKSEIYQDIPPQVPFYAPLVGAVESFKVKTEVWNLGMRYDFHPSAAFKVQLTQSDDKVTNEKDQLLTVGIDLVF